ncbi:MAG: hypothetical protein HY791_31955 [Deltaproteobacteria bacterium]|nr:hypothetical protein [Deltaproteobacteria bacterium]
MIMFEGSDTMPAPTAPHVSPPTFSLIALLRRDREALDRLDLQARDLARALAAAATVEAADGALSEFEDRFRTLASSLSSQNPMEGFRLRSSLGAFALARLAFGWAPPSATELRDEPLTPETLVKELVRFRASPEAARHIVASFEIDEAALRDAFPEGLEPTDLAGLAEGCLTRREHSIAMTQVAVSPRCLVRLATTARVLEQTRAILPILPSERLRLDSAYTVGMAALALGRPDRALAVIGHRPSDPLLVPIAELAEVSWLLGRGDPVELIHDPTLMAVDYEEALADPAAFADAPNRPSIVPTRPAEPGAFDEGTPDLDSTVDIPSLADDAPDDEYLEVVEEPVEQPSDPGSNGETIPPPSSEWRAPRPPTWSYPDGAQPSVRDRDLSRFYVARLTRRATLATTGDMLGLRLHAMPPWIPALSIPPDPATLARILSSAEGDIEALSGTAVVEAIVPSVRAVLRIAAAAGEGWTPTSQAVETAGDLSWIVRRARALALVGRGDLEAAHLTVAALGGVSSPEGALARSREVRFAGRTVPPLDPSIRRKAAAALVRDLALAFARTVAGLSV